uniref:Uncharacterized protein n=1 Tax=Junco hyemalis TaxID=40217 RepID=A0A8C5IZ89_JUNHY
MAGPGGAAGPAAARELLDVRPRPGLEDILLINSKCSSKKATTLQTVKLPRSNVLDRVQSFLPQMAQANDELKRKMVTAPAHQFDIEHLDSETEEVIEMAGRSACHSPGDFLGEDPCYLTAGRQRYSKTQRPLFFLLPNKKMDCKI